MSSARSPHTDAELVELLDAEGERWRAAVRRLARAQAAGRKIDACEAARIAEAAALLCWHAADELGGRRPVRGRGRPRVTAARWQERAAAALAVIRETWPLLIDSPGAGGEVSLGRGRGGGRV